MNSNKISTSLIFDGGEQNAKVGGEEFFDFSFSIFFILFDKKTYKMYYVHIYQTLFLLQNKFCTFFSNTPNGAPKNAVNEFE